MSWLRNVSPKRILGITFRLSLVVGLIAAGVDAYRVNAHYSEANVEYRQTAARMDCAIKVPVEQLRDVKTDYELYDLSKFCAPKEFGGYFLVREEELSAHRRGEFMKDNDYRGRRFNWQSTGTAFITYAAFINIIGLILLAAAKTLRWVIG